MPFCPLEEKPPWGGFCSQVCSSQRWGRVLHTGARLGGPTLAPPKSHRILCLLYWCCWLGGSELALGARSA